jgi:hypothetical protein
MVLKAAPWLAALLLSALAPMATAQTAQPTERARPAQSASTAPAKPPMPRVEPTDANAPVPPVVYRSALAKPPPIEVPLASWLQANEAVWRIGGWRSYAREASQSPTRAPAPPAAAPSAPKKH